MGPNPLDFHEISRAAGPNRHSRWSSFRGLGQWHFDYKDWKQYPILNVKFEDLGQLEMSPLLNAEKH
jgi:hypothetical protein